MHQMHFPDFRLAGRHTHRSLASLVWSSYIWDQALRLILIQLPAGSKPPACGVGGAWLSQRFLHHVRRGGDTNCLAQEVPYRFHTPAKHLLGSFFPVASAVC